MMLETKSKYEAMRELRAGLRSSASIAEKTPGRVLRNLKRSFPKLGSKASVFKTMKMIAEEQIKGFCVCRKTLPTLQRTSKNVAEVFTFLLFDDKNPNEVLLKNEYEIADLLIESKKPTDSTIINRKIKIFRHLLVRDIQRNNVKNFKGALALLTPYIESLIFYRKDITAWVESKNIASFIVLSEDGYIVCDLYDGYLRMKTIIPRSSWSLTKRKKLNQLVSTLNTEKYNDTLFVFCSTELDGKGLCLDPNSTSFNALHLVSHKLLKRFIRQDE